MPRRHVTRGGLARLVRRWRAPVLVAWLASSAAGCLYGFAGGGLPRDLKTVAVLPFENDTPVPEVQRELFEALRKAMQDRLNLRDAPADRADVLVTGTIKEYEIDLPVGVTADPRQATSARRKLQLVVDFDITNQRTGEPLASRRAERRESQYAEGAEARGRREAIEQFVNKLIDDMLSQW
jgi:hypothetical protein